MLVVTSCSVARAADWLQSDGCLCWPERLLLQPLPLSYTSAVVHLPAHSITDTGSCLIQETWTVYMQLYKSVLEYPCADVPINTLNICLCLQPILSVHFSPYTIDFKADILAQV